MKIIKLTIISLLIGMVIMSCSDDSKTPVGNGDGDGDGDNLPATKVTLVTKVNGEVIDTKTIEKVDNKYVPSDYSPSGSYADITKMFIINFSQIESKYVFQLNAILQEYKTGKYELVENDGKFLLGSYINKELDEGAYNSDGATLEISKITYVGTDQIGTYYTNGTLTMKLTNDMSETSEVDVVATFEGVPITTQKFNL